MKLQDVTPTAFFCTNDCLPAVYETDRGTYLIIRSKVASPENHHQ